MGHGMEKSDESGCLFGGVETSEGVVAEDTGPLLGVSEEGGRHLGFEEAGQNAVDTDIPCTVFLGETFGEADEPGFGSGVVGLARGAGEGGDGADLDDVTTPLLGHSSDRSLRTEEGPLETNVHHVVEVVLGHFEDRLVADDSRVVDEEINAFELSEPGFHLGGVRDIELGSSRVVDDPTAREELLRHRSCQITLTSCDHGDVVRFTTTHAIGSGQMSRRPHFWQRSPR